MKNTHLLRPATRVFKQLKMWRSQHELVKRYTGLRAIFDAGSISPRSVANKVYIYTLDQANIHPGDSRGKEIMPFSTKLNEKVCTYTPKRPEMLKDGTDGRDFSTVKSISSSTLQSSRYCTAIAAPQ